MKVRYSWRALSDLAAISNYLTERSPRGARAVGQAIRSTVSLIAEFPGCGRAVKQRPQVRVIPVSRYPYLLYYTTLGEAVVVLHIRHAARKPVDPHEL